MSVASKRDKEYITYALVVFCGWGDPYYPDEEEEHGTEED